MHRPGFVHPDMHCSTPMLWKLIVQLAVWHGENYSFSTPWCMEPLKDVHAVVHSTGRLAVDNIHCLLYDKNYDGTCNEAFLLLLSPLAGPSLGDHE